MNLDARAATPGLDLNLANWTSNRFENPDLETWYDSYSPSIWYPWSTQESFTWYASSPWPVNEGSRSAGMQCRSRQSFYSDARWSQSSINADMDNLSLTFDWYLEENEDPTNNYFYFDIGVYQIGWGWRYMYYTLNGSFTGTNSTYYGYYKASGPTQQWNTFSRNITNDFISNPSFPSTLPANLEFRDIYIYIVTQTETDQYMRSFLDDFNLVNETNSYVWIGGATRNGNFEGSSNWGKSTGADYSVVSRSNLVHSGLWSANLTALSIGNQSHCELHHWPDSRITALNQGILSFWWYLSYERATSNSFSYAYLSFYNNTHYYDIMYLLGNGGSIVPFGNSSNFLVICVDGYNTTNTWMYCERNIWTDAAAYFGANEFFPNYVYFSSYAYGQNSRTVTLIDDTKLKAGAVNDGGYEDQGAVGSRVRGWGYPYDENNELRVTDTVYAGNKAANFTLTNGAAKIIVQYLNGRPLNSSRETYLDAMWRLEDYTPTSGNNAYLRVALGNGRNLYYYIASYSGLLSSNTSSYGYFNVTGASTMGTWMQMHRDLAHDYEAVFGSLPDTYIDTIYLNGFTSGGKRLELLFDDLYLYDDPAPRTSNTQRNPLSPNHNEAAQISTDAVDQDLDTVMLFYRLDSGSWQNTTMAYQSGDTYAAAIPGQPHGTFVEYYVTANDTWGMTTTALDGGSYWSYTAWDQIPPDISAVSHTPDPVQYSDIVNVTADVVDTETGITSVLLCYQVDGGPFQQVGMTYITGDTFKGQIPTQAWNAQVKYYINATDNMGNWKVDNNGGLLYSYTVGDTTDPVISISAPTDGEEISGSIDISVTASDAGSGIAQVEFFIDGVSIGTDSSSPYSYSWDTTTVINGNYTIMAVAHDGAGNSASSSITVTVNNMTPVIPGFPIEAIALALTVGIAFSLIRRRRHA